MRLPVLLPRERVSAEYWASRGGGEGTDGRQGGKRTTDTEKEVLENKVDEEIRQNRGQLRDPSPVKLIRTHSEKGDVMASKL